DPEEAMYVADRIAVMNGGRLHQVDTPTAIYLQPADAFVAGFFGEVNRLGGTITDGVPETGFAGLASLLAAATPAEVVKRDGASVDIVLRQEALALAPTGAAGADGCPVRVVAARYLGRSSLIDVAPAKAAPDGSGGDGCLRVRVWGRYLPEAGTQLDLSVRDEGAFVFAA
ncbi:MAG: Fe3+/spermidine/putrescine ABC transporter ATP-binding protein, partial [Alphaproteobacteria bacterium]